MQTAVISAVLDVPARSLAQWVKDGLVVPDHYVAVRARGGGRPHEFSEVNLVEFALLKELRSQGCPIKVIQSFLDSGRRTKRRDYWFNLSRDEALVWVRIDNWQDWSVVSGNDMPLDPTMRVTVLLNLSHIKVFLRQRLALYRGQGAHYMGSFKAAQHAA